MNGTQEMPRCSTCHWWFGDHPQFRICVFHVGMKTAKTRRIDYGGAKPLRTTADFGCVDWQKDTRPLKLNLQPIPPLE
jgi:hypothetical protein